ncbi:hypothetical protein PMI42_06050 [Bradyrhizobium sp. YR681]|uniref:hypothetical protein n=1 Tax=Bradyrhizobium sp. YR681 TaxID=1144344 RepID=UPI00026F8EDF|nr:hypothetical protein [Bradyrhizobium sp. YR681]EJN10642.1 hypothetical protein PMI42_06050 [Bradyrhizobium sp. YR681]
MPQPADHCLYCILRDFQPTLAAIIALGAAALAYYAATQKIRHDKKVADRELALRRLGVYMRTQSDAELVEMIARTLKPQAKTLHAYLLRPDQRSADDPTIESTLKKWRLTSDMNETWQNLHLFPAPIARRVNGLRRSLMNFVFESDSTNYRLLADPDRGAEWLTQMTTTLEADAAAIVSELDHLIAEIGAAVE